MTRRGLLVVAATAALASVAWHEQLFTVAKPGERPRALVATPAARRPAAEVDVVLPAVPVGMERLRQGAGVTLIHYWAPWEHEAKFQVTRLDSLRQLAELQGMRVAVVCFDPFPSVARYVARHRLRLSVLLDTRRELAHQLPCPSMPYTYVLDRAGRVAVAQPGEVDWWADGTRATLRALLAEPTPAAPPAREPAPPL